MSSVRRVIAGRHHGYEGRDTAQICLNGHVINSASEACPQFNKLCCDRCGEKTITACPKCETPIEGHYHRIRVGVSNRSAPAFCHNCGAAYPWTQARLKAARQLADELEGLKDKEKDLLKKSLDNIIRDTPGTPLAATRVKRVLAKAKAGGAAALREILKEAATEAAKKLIFGI